MINPDLILEKLNTDIAKIEPTEANISRLIGRLYQYLEGQDTPATEKARNVHKALMSSAMKAVQGQVGDAQLALAGINELGQAVLDSGIPQAALLFAVTYKLIDGLAKAPEEAREELKVTPY